MKRHGSRIALTTAIVVLGALLTGCSAPAPAPTPTATASVDDPQPLTAAQADELAALPFRTYGAGITRFSGQVLGGDYGDLLLTGWIDFEADRGYAQATPPQAAPILIVWDAEQIAFLDVVDSTTTTPFPPIPVVDGGWQRSVFDPSASELTRMLAALLLLSEDRPDNAALVRQGGARFLGEEEVGGTTVQRFSGVAASGQAGDDLDLGTQYWLDADGNLVRFGLRLTDQTLSTIDFDHGGDDPASLPLVDALG